LTREEFVKKHAPWILDEEKQAMKNVARFTKSMLRGAAPENIDLVIKSIRTKLEGAKRNIDMALKSLDKYEKNPERMAPQMTNVKDLAYSAEGALRALGRVIAKRTASTTRTAYTTNVLDWVFKGSDLAGALFNADDQTQDLGHEVYDKLRTKLKLSSGEAEALGRLQDIATRGKNWDAALIRNNVFKAAHALKMKLPSMSF
jgi:hypothetical protein